MFLNQMLYLQTPKIILVTGKETLALQLHCILLYVMTFGKFAKIYKIITIFYLPKDTELGKNNTNYTKMLKLQKQTQDRAITTTDWLQMYIYIKIKNFRTLTTIQSAFLKMQVSLGAAIGKILKIIRTFKKLLAFIGQPF